MTPSQPPAFATWLLDQFGVNDSTVGDLIERYQRQGSLWWYWRQVIATIAAIALRNLEKHKLLAVRAFLTSWAVLWAFGIIPFGAWIWTLMVAWELNTRWRKLVIPSRSTL